MRLTATRAFRRGGRNLKPGDEFTVVSGPEGRALIALGKAAVPVPPDERDALRQRAEELGVEVDKRWGVARLEEEIATAAAGYERRDMRAKE